jgi:transcription antitermination factor NusG
VRNRVPRVEGEFRPDGTLMAVACSKDVKKEQQGAVPGAIPNAKSNELSSGDGDPERQFPWFALQVRTRQELGVAEFLKGRGYKPFLPLCESRKVWSDRIKISDVPLFPGYLFCRVNIQDRLPILTAPGVIRIVGYNRLPIPVDEAEISAIQAIVSSGLPKQPWPFLKIGERVQITSGPLRGLDGILVDVRGGHHLVISVSLLQRSVAVKIDSAFVKPLKSRAIAPLESVELAMVGGSARISGSSGAIERL